jgi:hypothetical protein
MENIFDVSVLNYLVLSVPGYFLIASSGFKIKSEFGWAAQSIFWGTLFVSFMNFITPAEIYTNLFNNPYAGMGVFTVYAIVVGYGVRILKEKITFR